jgi:iron complex transport system substrate-binding protein
MTCTSRLLVAGALAVLLAGCGAGPSAPSGASTSAGSGSTAVNPPPRAVDGEKTLAELAAVHAGLGTDAAPGEFPRTVRHAAGETVIETRPARIVTLDSSPRDTLTALGITPAGIADGTNDPEALADVPRVGVIGEPNFEAIAALAPDLILTSEARTEGEYGKLAAIAPTVSNVMGGPLWKQDFALTVAALGAEREAADLVARYEKRAAEIAELATAAGDPQVSLVRLRSDDMRMYARSSFGGQVLDDAGLRRPDAQNLDVNHQTISLENLTAIDADLVLVASDDAVSAERRSELRSSPMWTTLSASQRNQIHDIDAATWIAGGGYFAALHMLDDLERILTGYRAQ